MFEEYLKSVPFPHNKLLSKRRKRQMNRGDDLDFINRQRRYQLIHNPILRKQMEWDIEADVPTKILGPDLILRGEDYTNFDPMRHYKAWEHLYSQPGILELGEEEIFDEEGLKELVGELPINNNYYKRRMTASDEEELPELPFVEGFLSGWIKLRTRYGQQVQLTPTHDKNKKGKKRKKRKEKQSMYIPGNSEFEGDGSVVKKEESSSEEEVIKEKKEEVKEKEEEVTKSEESRKVRAKSSAPVGGGGKKSAGGGVKRGNNSTPNLLNQKKKQLQKK
jgi:hypothetical protein